MNDGLFEDYGEAILYVMLALMVLGLMAVTIGAVTAFYKRRAFMDEAVTQSGELIISIAAAIVIAATLMLLLGKTDAGILRAYLVNMLEAAC